MRIKLVLLLSIFSLYSCQKDILRIDITLPETSVVSSNSRWGVVKYPYIRVRKSPDKEDIISSAFRQGDIVKILKSSEITTSVDGGDIYWFYTVFDEVEGWVPGENLSIFESREQALTASKMLQ